MLPTTDKVCSIEEVEENFDTVVLGSDEVWNFYNPMFGKDLSYFGQGVKSSKIISYAASFGTRTPEYGIDEDVKEAIKKIDSISVRDINSNEMIESIGLNVEIVADPTFLIDQKDHLVDIKTNEDYLLFYGFMLHEGDIRLIKDFARENNLKIISVGYKNRWCDLNILDANPFEWNTYVHNAKYVVTTMFHGLVYSIIHEKQFVFVMNDYRRYKVGYLMKYLKLDSSTYYHENDNIIDKMLSHIDYKFINSNLNELIANSKEFLIREI
ncbi:polysaccharide pyruvyl transferase family protein [Vibrio gazogenes]